MPKRIPSLSFSRIQIKDMVEIIPDVFLLSFERSFHFKAGQVIGIRLKENEPHRLYSIASGENENLVSILFDINPKGLLTPRLAKLRPGHYLEHTQPFGFFISDNTPAYWIATGTGIAPFRSMFRSGISENVRLIHGARHLSQFYFQHEFLTGLQKSYVRCSSRQHAEDVYFGRVTQYLQEVENLDTSYRFYLCGSAEMVVETRDILISKGVPFGQIRAEIYF